MKKDKSQNTENLRTKYLGSLTLYTSEGQIQWSRYNAMLIVNTIFIAVIGFAFDLSPSQNLPFLIKYALPFTPLLGIIICLLWYRMTERGFIWMKHWIQKANNLETYIGNDVNPIKDGKDLRDRIGGNVTQGSSYWIIGIFVGIYLLIFIGNIIS